LRTIELRKKRRKNGDELPYGTFEPTPLDLRQMKDRLRMD
jgi:hypothetical protein